MNKWQQILLGLKVMFGRYHAYRYYYNPKVGASEVSLRHKGFTWDLDTPGGINVDNMHVEVGQVIYINGQLCRLTERVVHNGFDEGYPHTEITFEAVRSATTKGTLISGY